MDESQMASENASKVVSDTKFWIAIIGLIGAIVGSVLTIVGNLILHWVREKPKNDLDKKRVSMHREMLDDDRFRQKWRDLSTLCAVIGASEEETKRFLFLAEARV